MKKTIWAVIIVIVVIGIVVLFKNSTNTELAQGPSKVTAAAVIPMTGPASFFGEELANGMKLANKDNKINLIVEDSQSTPTGGVTAFQRSVLGKPDIAIVAMSSIAPSVAPMAFEMKMPILQTIVSIPNVASKSPYSFRYFTSSAQESPIAAELTVKTLGKKKLAVFHSSDEYGISYADIFTSSAESFGAKVVANESFDSKSTDYRTQLTKIASQKPDAIYITALDKTLPIIVKQMRDLGITATLVTNWILSNPAVAKTMGPLGEGMYFTGPSYNFGTASDFTKAFKKEYLSVYQKDPSAYAAIGYDIVNMLGSISVDKGDDSTAIISKLKGLGKTEGAMGDLTIDANKEITFALYPAKIENGQVVMVNSNN